MIHVETENDVWKLFWNDKPPEDGHEKPGQKVVLFDALKWALKDVRLKDTSRRYYLFYCDLVPETWDGEPPWSQAVVPQSRLLKVGQAMMARDHGNTVVHYLGGDPESARSNAKTT